MLIVPDFKDILLRSAWRAGLPFAYIRARLKLHTLEMRSRLDLLDLPLNRGALRSEQLKDKGQDT
jgi:hypothetical protein